MIGGAAPVPTLVLALGLAVAAAQAPGAAAADDPIEARVFRVSYKPLADAADVVAPLLSEEGSLTLRARLGVLVVQDRASVLDRIAALLEGFDLPPRDVEVTLTLFLGMDRREDEGSPGAAPESITREIRGIQEVLADFTKWQDYQPLGSRSVTGVEGSSVTADLTADYRVVFSVDVVDPERGMVKFDRVVLQRLRRDESGRESVEQVLSMGMKLELDRLRVVGAASGPDSRRALFLALEARER
jgi:hypothetical protein